MNILEDRLKSSSIQVILETIKVFIRFASMTKDEQIMNDVINRVQAPLITLMAGSEVSNTHELTFVILSHIKFVVSRGNHKHFSEESKRFYCKIDEPSYI